MFLLDNNAFKLFIVGDEAMVARIEENIESVFLSSIAAEEFLVPYLNAINRARAPRTSLSLPRAHHDLVEAIENLNTLPILPYDDKADAIFRTFPPALVRVGSQDCRIAAQAIAHQMTIVTRNLQDFAAIGAPCEDWAIL